jgi:hypothetical protein
MRPDANGPPKRAARHLTTAAPSPPSNRGADEHRVTQDAELAELLDRSDERDLYLRRIEAAWRDGFAAGELAHAGDYAQGVCDGIMRCKRRDRLMVEMIRLQVGRYGPDSRQVTDPQRSDFPGVFRDRGQDGAA